MKPVYFFMAALAACFVTPSFAVSDDECSIWLCLPGGFPGGCESAKAAFKKRIKHGKSPLPDFASCAVSDGAGGQGSYQSNSAAYIPASTGCAKYEYTYNNYGGRVGKCVKPTVIPEQIVKGMPCITMGNQGERKPAGCTKTLRYIEVFQDGQQIGDTYYW